MDLLFYLATVVLHLVSVLFHFYVLFTFIMWFQLNNFSPYIFFDWKFTYRTIRRWHGKLVFATNRTSCGRNFHEAKNTHHILYFKFRKKGCSLDKEYSRAEMSHTRQVHGFLFKIEISPHNSLNSLLQVIDQWNFIFLQPLLHKSPHNKVSIHLQYGRLYTNMAAAYVATSKPHPLQGVYKVVRSVLNSKQAGWELVCGGGSSMWRPGGGVCNDQQTVIGL